MIPKKPAPDSIRGIMHQIKESEMAIRRKVISL